MEFNSILFDQDSIQMEELKQPEYLADLLLDQVIDAIISPKKEYDLKYYFYLPLEDIDLIQYRTEIFKDLENQELLNLIQNFSHELSTVRHGLNLIKHLEFPFNKMGWHLDIALTYCKSLIMLSNGLEKIKISSKGLAQLKDYLFTYINSDKFKLLYAEALRVKADLQAIRYSINVQTGELTVEEYKGEKDYSDEILSLFERFRTNKNNDVRIKKTLDTGMNHVESIILEYVSHLFPEPFEALKKFFNQFPIFVEDKILLFDREVQFYIAYLDFIAEIKIKGYNFCYPDKTMIKEEIYDYDGFDLSLTLKLLNNDLQIIKNDFFLNDPEKILVVSGPNQGGKTSFARMFGQLHFLVRLGVPVPGTKAKLFISDNIFTHFEREESISTLQGKLMEELTRIKSIFSQLTSNSIFIMNEIFNSTTLDDAIYLGKEIISKLEKLGTFCVVVTFIEEISNLGPSFVSMVSNIDPDNPAMRTFKISRRPADGRAYALAIAKNHKLTLSQINERISF